MDDETVQALEEINRHFYERRAEPFSDTRRGPWRGWQRLLRGVSRELASVADGQPPRVLDVGCGNARLALFLAGELGEGTFSYLGIDASLPLLSLARQRLPTRCQLLDADVTSRAGLSFLRPASCSLVAAFGVLHHVAGSGRRRALVSAMARAARPGGLLWLSFWQFARDDRLRRRTLSWEEYNRRATRPVDTTRLEDGDLLLRWGEEGSAVRYCHDTEPAEAERLVQGLGLELVDRLEDDGPQENLNLYLALRRTAG